MIINKFTIDSFYLQRPVRVTMAMPYPIMDKNITVIWALHCSLKDENFFFDYLGIGRFVDLKKIVVVSPSIDDPWGGENGSIRDFLHNELKPWIHSTFGFSQDPSFNVVLGISMGAYEALKWAIDCPNDFNKIALFSGVYDFNLYNPNEIKKDRIQFVLHKLIKPQIDKYHKKSDGTYSGSLFQEIEKLNNNLSVYIYCGNKDYLSHNQSLELKRLLDINNVNAYMSLSEGGHDALYWSLAITDFLSNL